MSADNEGYVFGLDIGTRSIVGTVGYRIGTDRFVVAAQEIIEHTTRAVIDGQIHDIPTVANMIRQIKDRLELHLHQKLQDVSIAAAGRVLKTKQVRARFPFASETKVTQDHIKSLDMLGVEQAYEEIRTDMDGTDKKFYCVGYSTVKYYLNGYPMEMIERHMANFIEVDLLATFLPEEVVDGLYAAVEDAGLHVASLTLEPIAAINIAIPEKFRLLNIALVDVGAGTSDISIVKDGSIIAFGMIPLAGDEITEAIAKKYLTDFETAERVKRSCERKKTVSIKDIFGQKIQVTKEDVVEISKEVVHDITKHVAERILELNGDQKVSAVFVVGGGGKHEGFTEMLAEHLGLPTERVAIRGAEVLEHITFEQPGIQKDSTMVTPLGICMNYYEQKNNFIHVTVNDQRVKLYDNGKVTVLDACISSGFSRNNLFPIRGDGIRYTVNGEEKEQKGNIGEVALIHKNGKEVSLNELVQENDEIRIKPSTKGKPHPITIGEIPECREELSVTLFDRTVLCPKLVEVNGTAVTPLYRVQNGDRIETFDYYSVSGLLEFADVDVDTPILLNDREAGAAAKIHTGDVITRRPQPVVKEEETKEKEPEEPVDPLQKQLEEDPLLQPQKPLPEWMKGIPFDTGKIGADGNVIPGQRENRPPEGRPAAVPEKPNVIVTPVHVTVNGKAVTMPVKPNPIFVDVFDVYPFDMSKAGGTKLITKINGADKDFTEPVHEGDTIELFWEK